MTAIPIDDDGDDNGGPDDGQPPRNLVCRGVTIPVGQLPPPGEWDPAKPEGPPGSCAALVASQPPGTCLVDHSGVVSEK